MPSASTRHRCLHWGLSFNLCVQDLVWKQVWRACCWREVLQAAAVCTEVIYWCIEQALPSLQPEPGRLVWISELASVPKRYSLPSDTAGIFMLQAAFHSCTIARALSHLLLHFDFRRPRGLGASFGTTPAVDHLLVLDKEQLLAVLGICLSGLDFQQFPLLRFSWGTVVPGIFSWKHSDAVIQSPRCSAILTPKPTELFRSVTVLRIS